MVDVAQVPWSERIARRQAGSGVHPDPLDV
jgi:hypothetical protein